MKVFLDLTRLLKEGKITQQEYDKLSQLSSASTGSLAYNILIGFGVVAVTCATIALIPAPTTVVFMGILLLAVGMGLFVMGNKWGVLAQICILIGSLLLCGGLLWLFDGTPASWLLVTLLLLAGAILTQSGLFTVLAVVALSATVGASANYSHATYEMVVTQPLMTVIVFSVLAFITYYFSKYLSPDYERLAIIASRTSIFLVNFGFWIGSLWGDILPRGGVVPDWAFAIVWALALIGVGVWAVKADKRWVLNVAAIFGAILFFTQWFERFGATPLNVLIAGILALGFAIGLKLTNKRLKKSD